MKYNIGEFFIYPHGTIIRIVDIINPYNSYNNIKVRAVNSCKGKMCKIYRIGHSYIYQFWTSTRKLNKSKVKRIGTEEILTVLFDDKYPDKFENMRNIVRQKTNAQK